MDPMGSIWIPSIWFCNNLQETSTVGFLWTGPPGNPGPPQGSPDFVTGSRHFTLPKSRLGLWRNSFGLWLTNLCDGKSRFWYSNLSGYQKSKLLITINKSLITITNWCINDRMSNSCFHFGLVQLVEICWNPHVKNRHFWRWNHPCSTAMVNFWYFTKFGTPDFLPMKSNFSWLNHIKSC